MAREARDGAHVARVSASMTCPACGHENRDDAAFCEECGGRLEQICSSCETANALSAKFCRTCGTALVSPAATISPEPVPRTYTPKHLAEKILQSKFALEGERKQVTVLFADVKSSVELSAQVDLEEWHRILDRFFRILTEGVHRFEGTVNQYTGDGIMALFGAPIAHEDHAQRACYAALRIRDALRRFTEELRTTSGVEFHTRIGLNCGDVIVGKIGDDLRMDYTAQGQTVGLASRVEGLANPGEVCLTAHTARLVEGYFQLRDRGLFPLKGLAEPQRLYELTGVGRLHTRLDVARAHGLSQFVGRTAELATLELALQRTRAGDGQVVGVVGEAGVGKSRLCLEFVERCRAEAMRVIEAQCPAYGKTIPFLPILQLLRNVFGITDGDSDQIAREKMQERLLLLDPTFEEVLPLVEDFLGVSDPEHPVPPMVPEVRQRQLFAFLRRLVQAEGAREPVVLLIDDLHWIDPGSETFLAQLVEAVSGTRTLLLLNFRPEYHPAWTSASYYHQLPLSPLGPEAIDVLLHVLLGTDPLVISLPDLIRERTGGNPFFIEEVIQSLAESGVLAGAQGAYRLTGTMGAFAIPATVQPVLAARIDRLPEREKQVLQTAAVIGRQFAEPLLGRVVQLSEADLTAALSHLRSAEFIREKAFYPEVEYVFKHSLTQEVAYNVQLSERRKQLHAAVAQGLEDLYADKLDEQAALLAHHWEQGGEMSEALRWHERAARWTGEHEPFEADRHWRRVRALAQQLPESLDATRAQVQSCQSLLKLGPLVGISGEEARAIFLEGTTLARAQQDLPALARLEIGYAQIRVEHNEIQDALDHAQEALRFAVRLDDLWLRVRAALQVMSALLWLGRFHDGWEVCQRTLELVGEPAELGRNAFAYLALLELKEIFMNFMGRPREGLAIFDRLITVARELGVEEHHSDFYHEAVFAASFLGDAERALQLAHREVELAERYGAAFMRIGAQHALAQAKNLNGDWEGALEAVATMHTLITETGVGLRFEVVRLIELSAAQLGHGDHVSARESATEARRLARARDLKFPETWAVVHLIRAVLADGLSATAEAEALIAQAIQLIDATGMTSFQPELSESRAELARLVDDDPARSRYLHDAQRLYTEMGATAHAERVARELAL